MEFLWYHAVTTVTNTTTALDMLRERKGRDDQFDLVVSDIFMVDDIDGFKLLEHISLEMDIPVICKTLNPCLNLATISVPGNLLILLRLRVAIMRSSSTTCFNLDMVLEILTE